MAYKYLKSDNIRIRVLHLFNLPSSIKDNQEEMCTLMLPSYPAFPIANLAVLLPIISTYKKQYKLLSTQCYWFVNIVF